MQMIGIMDLSAGQRFCLLLGGMVIIVVLGFFCFYHPDCPVCQFLDAFG